MGILDVPPAPYAPEKLAPYRQTSGTILFQENHIDSVGGMWNDGCGSATIDREVMFNDHPTIRMDPQLNLSPASGLINNTSTLKSTGSVALTTTSNATLIGSVINSGTPTLPSSGFFQCIGTDGNTYLGTYTGQSYSSPNVTLTGCNLMTVAANPAAVAASLGTAMVNQPGTSCTVPVYGTGPTEGLIIVGNPWINCGISPDTAGVVYKRRIADNFSAPFGCETWVRYTSSKASGTSLAGNGSGIANGCWSMSLYNRDGANAWYTRLMVQTNVVMANGSSNGQSVDNGILWVCTGGSTSSPVLTPLAILEHQSFNQHSWDPTSDSWDRAGIWHYGKIVNDMANKLIVSVQFDDMYFPLNISIPSIAAVGSAKVMHFSTEFKQGHATGNTDSRCWVNVGPIVGTLE